MTKYRRVDLGSMVDRYGYETVHRLLHEIAFPDAEPQAPVRADGPDHMRPKGNRRLKGRRSAVDYVQAMEISRERAAIVKRAAEEFERRVFLPTLSELRSFCEAYGIAQPRSRSGGIPRIFKFLVTMSVAEVERILNDPLFSGPATLGPIAAAIRDKAQQRRTLEPSEGRDSGDALWGRRETEPVPTTPPLRGGPARLRRPHRLS